MPLDQFSILEPSQLFNHPVFDLQELPSIDKAMQIIANAKKIYFKTRLKEGIERKKIWINKFKLRKKKELEKKENVQNILNKQERRMNMNNMNNEKVMSGINGIIAPNEKVINGIIGPKEVMRENKKVNIRKKQHKHKHKHKKQEDLNKEINIRLHRDEIKEIGEEEGSESRISLKQRQKLLVSKEKYKDLISSDEEVSNHSSTMGLINELVLNSQSEYHQTKIYHQHNKSPTHSVLELLSWYENN